MIPVPTDEAVKEVESIILGVDTDITRWQQRQNSRNNFTAEVPRTMEQKRENSRGFMDDLTQNDQRMIFSLITLVHTADSLEELVALKAIANSLQKRVHANYRFVLTFNSALIALGALGILQPASSAMLHNLSTIGISLKSMTNLLPENKAPQLKA